MGCWKLDNVIYSAKVFSSGAVIVCENIDDISSDFLD